MGVSRFDYVVLGVKLSYDEQKKIHGERLYEFFEERPKPKPLDVIFDGMSGEYIVVGKVLAKSGESRWDNDGFEFCSITQLTTPALIEEVRTALREFKVDGEPEVWAFSHFH